MSATKILWGQLLLVGAAVLAFLCAATQWTACPARLTHQAVAPSAAKQSSSGIGGCAGAARERGWYGRRWRSWRTSSSPSRVSCTPGPVYALPSDTRGRSRVPELGSLGSVRGALSNGRPYREHPKLRFSSFYSNAKIRRQSFFILITVQPLLFASSYNAWVKVPTVVSGRPPAGP
jgi:hypothetical protein